MENKFTPGPHYAVQYGPYFNMQDTPDYSESNLLDLQQCDKAEANAKLYKAATELLSIAKRVAFIFDNEANYPEGTIGYDLGKSALEAIKKATI